MRNLRAILRIVVGAVLAVAISVSANQVLTDHRLSFAWAYLSTAIAILAALCVEYFAPAPQDAARPGRAKARRRVYLRQLRSSVDDMETLGVPIQSEYPLPMDQVYVDVSLQPKPAYETRREPYLGAVSAPDRSPAAGERRSLDSFLDERVRGVLVVIGGPGSGKTTLARNTALSLSRPRRWSKGPLPILVYLRDHATAILADSPADLAEVATSVAWLAGKVPADWVRRRLDQGGCVVLMDGLDEVAAEAGRGTVVTWIQHQIQRFPANRYVITSRPYGYLSNPLPSATVLQVRRFTGEQISAFLHGWYHAIECRIAGETGEHVRSAASRKADDLLARLRDTPALYDLAANPLLLTMTANVHRYCGQLPGSRADLYREMCDVLLYRRQEARRLDDPTGLRGSQKGRVVRRLALTMMRERTRDLPADEARKVIKRALRQFPGDVDPRVFLEEARKSGLLVEREHDLYGFAHLTMQEYLASAQIGRQEIGLLTENVDDPWWRETTLLWASDNDATPVIRACLDSGTIASLSLAFDCADQKEEIDPDVRSELEELLRAPDDEVDDDRRNLLNGVRASRSLRDVIRLGEGTLVCARPAAGSLYEAFVRDMRAAGLPMPDGRSTSDGFAAGLLVDDAARFIAWLNALFDDGTVYRLPTSAELADPALDLVGGLAGRVVWAGPQSSAGLHRPDDAAWPHVLSRNEMRDQIRSDRDRVGPLLYLALSREHREHVRILNYGVVLATALTCDDDGSEALDTVLDCALARVLVDVVGGHSAARYAGSRDRVLALARAPHGDPGLVLDVLRASLFDVVSEEAFPKALTRAADRARTLDPELFRLVELLNSEYDQSLHRPTILFGAGLDRVLARALDVATPLVRSPGVKLGEALVFARDLGQTLHSDSGFGLELADDLARHGRWKLASALGPSEEALRRILDIAIDLARALNTPALKVVEAGFRGLLLDWEPPAEKTVTGLSGYLGTLLEASLPDEWGEDKHAVEDPLMPIAHARELMTARRHPDLPALDAVIGLLEPMLRRTEHWSPLFLACARLGLLGLANLLASGGLPDAAADLREAWAGLLAVEKAGNKPGERLNDVLLLVRG